MVKSQVIPDVFSPFLLAYSRCRFVSRKPLHALGYFLAKQRVTVPIAVPTLIPHSYFQLCGQLCQSNPFAFVFPFVMEPQALSEPVSILYRLRWPLFPNNLITFVASMWWRNITTSTLNKKNLSKRGQSCRLYTCTVATLFWHICILYLMSHFGGRTLLLCWSGICVWVDELHLCSRFSWFSAFEVVRTFATRCGCLIFYPGYLLLLVEWFIL